MEPLPPNGKGHREDDKVASQLLKSRNCYADYLVLTTVISLVVRMSTNNSSRWLRTARLLAHVYTNKQAIVKA